MEEDDVEREDEVERGGIEVERGGIEVNKMNGYTRVQLLRRLSLYLPEYHHLRKVASDGKGGGGDLGSCRWREGGIVRDCRGVEPRLANGG